MIYLKILFEFFILLIPITFALPTDSFIYNYQIISNNKKDIFDILIWVLPLSIIGRYIIEYRLFKYKKEKAKLLEAVKSYRSFLSGYIDDKLKDLSNDLERTESDRVSVFLYSSSANKFFSIGRYSHSSRYKKVGRYIIENKNEYLFSVLNDKEHYSKSPNISNKFWQNGKNKRNMESKDMFGVSLYDKQRQNKIGVVVFQSLEENVYTKQKRLHNKILSEVKKLNLEINKMNIEPNSLVSHNKPLEGL